MINIYRGPLTDEIVSYLTTQLATLGNGIPVGDGIVPKGAGWVGEPNAPTSVFQPYVVVMAGPSNWSGGPFDDPQADWHLAYMLASYNASRQGLDWMADRVREKLDGLRGMTLTLGPASYYIQQARVESIGGTNRIDQTDPPYWSQVDGFTVWVTR